MNSRVCKALALMLLSAACSGCASFHKKTVAAAPPPPDVPELSQTPLYSPAMSENIPRVPDLPATSGVAVVKPPPPPQKLHRAKKIKPTKTPDTPALASTTTASASDSSPAPSSVVEKKATTLQASMPASDAPAASPIGDLTTGSSAEAAETSHHAEDLVRSTRDGVEGIKRSLSADEKKTVAEIWAFLDRAEQAIKNGDVDGGYGLATKAKLLLDELTQK